MGSSDSETESECFESAEESFDENDENKNDKTKLKKNHQKCEKEASNIVVSDCHDSVETNTLNSSLSYRKRPERVKRLPSRTQPKPTSKSSASELVFKADKIVPDVFLQDITTNLSKNINKSLSTLQQKSSNVKDLILNSLPVSCADESEGFCYDDKSDLVDDENKTLGSEASHPNNNQSVESSGKENTNNVTEVLKDEVSNDLVNIGRESGNNVDKESEENIVDNIETFNDKKNLEKSLDAPRILTENVCAKTVNIASDEKEETIQNVNNQENLEKSSDAPRILTENVCAETVNIASDEKEETTQNVNNQENLETLVAAEEKDSKNTNKLESVEFIEETNQEIEISKKDENVHTEPEKITEEEKAVKVDELLGLVESDNSEYNPSLDICDESNFNSDIEDKNKECNLEELKTALKNIVKEENICTEENNKLEGSEDVKDNSGEGWDDFDFSDDENLDGSESQLGKKLEDVKQNDELTKSKSPDVDVKSCNESEKKNIKKTSTKSQDKKTILNVKKTEVEKPKTVPESHIAETDSWDWDSWDDTPDNKEVELTQTKKPEVKREKDVSKWSGWDTFGQKSQEKQDNWGLGSWGVDALLNKATAVTQGISSVLEAGLGAPDPETLARMEKIQRENSLETVKNTEDECPDEIPKKNSLTNVNIFPVSGITSLVAGVTSKIVEHSKIQEIGSKVITGGLETLETFGKKTMEVLQEGDPGLKNKRALLLGNNKPVLSQVLKEAREKAERESKKLEEKELAKKCHFETLFDDFQGLVHLEALEMLSRQCEIKLEQIRSGMNSEEQEDLNGILEEVEQLCSLDDIEMKSSMLDFKTVLQMAVEPLKHEISIQNIIQIHEDVSKWLQSSSETEPSFTVINQKLVSTLAELTAATVHQFHKSGELLSVKECRKTVEEVDALSRLTNALCMEINKLGEKFIKLSSIRTLKGPDNGNSINEKVNDVMKNSVFYIKQAFNLLIPVIQLGAAV